MEEQKSMDKRNIAGIILVVIGGLLLLNTFDIVGFSMSYYIFSWKTLLIAIGVAIVFKRETQITGYLFIGVGVLFWLLHFAGYYISFGKVFLPLMMIVIGIIVITRRGSSKDRRGRAVRNPDGTMNADYLDDVSILGGGAKRMQSDNFKGGNITSIFGGSEIDLKSVTVSNEGCVIDVFVMFGGNKLIVPHDWEVKSDALSIFGGFTDKRSQVINKEEYEKPQNVLVVKGIILFGGMEIKNY